MLADSSRQPILLVACSARAARRARPLPGQRTRSNPPTDPRPSSAARRRAVDGRRTVVGRDDRAASRRPGTRADRGRCRSIDGFIVDRLQGALLEEAFRLVARRLRQHRRTSTRRSATRPRLALVVHRCRSESIESRRAERRARSRPAAVSRSARASSLRPGGASDERTGDGSASRRSAALGLPAGPARRARGVRDGRMALRGGRAGRNRHWKVSHGFLEALRSLRQDRPSSPAPPPAWGWRWRADLPKRARRSCSTDATRGSLASRSRLSRRRAIVFCCMRSTSPTMPR